MENNDGQQLDDSNPQIDDDEDHHETTSTITRKKICTTVPLSRVNVIMRSCPNLTAVRNDAIALTSQAAELFIQDLVKNSYEMTPDKSSLTYNILADFIAQSKYTFLYEAIPQKITVEQYKQLQSNRTTSNNNDDSDEDEEEDDDDEDDNENESASADEEDDQDDENDDQNQQ